MKRIAIVFHSAKGHTRELAKAIYQGASRVPLVEPFLCELSVPGGIPWADLLKADAMIFGSPTFMGR